MPRDPQEHGQQPPWEGSASGELTDIFASVRPSAAPPSQADLTASTAQPPAESGGFTALFSAMNSPATGASMVAETTFSSEAPTQIFTAQPHAPAQTSTPPAADQTALFTPTNRVVPAAPPAATPPIPPGSGDFTQMFRPIAPPLVAPATPAVPVPATANPVSSAPAASGEFTQFFSAISAREAAVAKPQAAPATPPPVVPAFPSSASAQTPPPAPNAMAAQPGAFTQLFQQVQPPTADVPHVPTPAAPPPSASVLTTPVAPPPVVASAPDTQPGAFTQMFSQLKPPTAPAPISSIASPPSMPPTPVFAQPTPPLPAPPIFGAPAPRGSFTDVFAAQPTSPSASGSNAGFTDIFRPAPSAGDPFPAPGASSTPPAAYGSVPATFAVPPASPPVGAGDFTRLMQSLERPNQAASQIPAPLPMDAAFFNPAPAGAAAESEYTRVLRGAGAAPAGFCAAPQAPVAGSAAAPGLSLAPAAKEDAATGTDKPAKGKPRPLVLLLVVMNVLLLLALVVIGILVLRHK